MKPKLDEYSNKEKRLKEKFNLWMIALRVFWVLFSQRNKIFLLIYTLFNVHINYTVDTYLRQCCSEKDDQMS